MNFTCQRNEDKPASQGRISEMSVDRILLTGSSGFIGTSLVRTLRRNRISTVTLHRVPCSGSRAASCGTPTRASPVSRPQVLEGITAAVHLSGVNLAGRRWTSAYKREIPESRVMPTHALATLLARLKVKPAVLVCASAIGIYGDRGDEVLTESSLPGSGFLPEVCLAWEKATQPATDAGIRVVHLRFGVVLSSAGGCPGADAARLPRRLGRPAGERPAVDELDCAPRWDPGDRVCPADSEPFRAGKCGCAQPGHQSGIHPCARPRPSPTDAASGSQPLRCDWRFGEMAQATILAERARSAGSPECRGLRLRIS